MLVLKWVQFGFINTIFKNVKMVAMILYVISKRCC